MLRGIARHCRYSRALTKSRIFHFHTLSTPTISKTLLKPRISYPNLTFATKQQYEAEADEFETDKTEEPKIGRIFPDTENIYAFNLLPKLPRPFSQLTARLHISDNAAFQKLLDQNWRGSTPSQIVDAFLSVKRFCVEQRIQLSDQRFDKLVDGLMDHCDKLAQQQLLALIECIGELPPCDFTTSHNFHDIWSCLDDICIWRLSRFHLNTQILLANAWYLMSLGRLSDCLFEVINRNTRKAKFMNKEQLLHIFFLHNVCRKKPVDFEYEYNISKFVDELTVDELAIVALGYFKSKSKVKLKPILDAMIRKVSENSTTVHEITLSAILKVLRFTQNFMVIPEMDKMLDKLTPEIPRLSHVACLHIALIGTGVQFKHDSSLKASTEKIVKDIGNTEIIRVKEIERILNANTMFDFEPQTHPDLYRAAAAELKRPERNLEMTRYNRCLPSALYYLSMRGIYDYELMDHVLDMEFVTSVYGKRAKCFPRELFSLDASIEIECPDYKGHRVPPHIKYKAAKWLTEYAPSYDQWKKLTVGDKFFLDVLEHVSEAVGGKERVKVDHVLPHFSRADMVVCKDTSSGEFVEPIGFESYVLGDVMRPLLDNGRYHWYSIVTMAPNTIVRDSINTPLGSVIMKQRHLRAVGFEPIIVGFKTFPLFSKADKIEFFTDRFSNILNSDSCRNNFNKSIENS